MEKLHVNAVEGGESRTCCIGDGAGGLNLFGGGGVHEAHLQVLFYSTSLLSIVRSVLAGGFF